MNLAPRPWAAVSLVEREDGRILCVWNKRYGGWAMPGGLVEDGETLEEGQARELFEETGLRTLSRELVHEGKPNTSRPGRGSYCYMFRARTAGLAYEREIGHAVTWFTPQEFLQWSPFADFYRPFFYAEEQQRNCQRTCDKCGRLGAFAPCEQCGKSLCQDCGPCLPETKGCVL